MELCRLLCRTHVVRVAYVHLCTSHNSIFFLFVSAVAELQKQSALECALNNQAGPQQDCTQLKLAVSQLWFINTFALRDAFSLLDAVAPAFGQMVLAQLRNNICFYEKIVEEAAAPSS